MLDFHIFFIWILNCLVFSFNLITGLYVCKFLYLTVLNHKLSHVILIIDAFSQKNDGHMILTVLKYTVRSNGRKRRLICEFQSLGYYCLRNLFFCQNNSASNPKREKRVLFVVCIKWSLVLTLFSLFGLLSVSGSV